MDDAFDVRLVAIRWVGIVRVSWRQVAVHHPCADVWPRTNRRGTTFWRSGCSQRWDPGPGCRWKAYLAFLAVFDHSRRKFCYERLIVTGTTVTSTRIEFGCLIS